MSEIQNKIINVIAITVAVGFFCFASSWILFEFKGSSNSLKDTWSIVSSFFSGGAALIAAYIASLLFNDWREIKKNEIQVNYVLVIKKQVQDILNRINSNRTQFYKWKIKIRRKEFSVVELRQLSNEIWEFEYEIVVYLNQIILDMNELHYVIHKEPEDPKTNDLRKKIESLNKIGIREDNFHKVWEERITTNVLDDYFNYFTNDLTMFLYNEIITQYLDILRVTDE
ncbi:MAG: hypothetical protein DI627_14445 [Acinetobacter sp.]|uniref:hypothetical protein n=1 Tax=Acinetobacter sp. TaxID=472 RepID=UPI000DB20EAE|nr:hypothetical protein [Acinetobacter sp.]PZT84925.1 MAG: hypothetical protein DI627_14445 [Acinetobacter sp.]